MISDMEAVWEWVMQQNYESISTIGLSLGGLVSLVTPLPTRRYAVFWSPAFYWRDFLPPFSRLMSKTIPKHSKATIKLPTSGTGPKIHFRISFINELLELDIESYLRKFTTPTLLIQGTLDMVVNPKSSKKAFSLMPQDDRHFLKMVKGAPHDFKGVHLDSFILHTLTFLRNDY
jgi:esterase/lipase